MIIVLNFIGLKKKWYKNMFNLLRKIIGNFKCAESMNAN
jgi:hypothetical protein